MMLRGGDLNLNRSVRSFGDSTMERLKQAMLQHELMFRNQVCELHRLYWTQKDLMNELRIKGMDTDVTSSYSWLCKESEEKKNIFSMSSGAEEARNVGALEEFKGNSTYLLKSHQREFSLHLSADEFLSSNGKDPAFYHQAMNFRSKEVIDLESSVIKLEFREATDDQVFSGGFSAIMQKSPGVFGTQASVPCAPISSSITGNDSSQMASLIHLSEENGGQLQEQKPPLSYAGVGDSCIDASVNQPLKKQQARPVLFDLNLPHEDECSHDLKGLLEQEEGNSFPTETSFVAKQPLSDPATKISCENETSHLIFNGEDSTTSDCSLDSKLDLNATDDKNDTASGCQIQAECCEGSTDSSDQGSLSINAFSPSSMNLCKQIKDDVDVKGQDSNITSSNSINLPQTVNKDSANKPTNQEGSEEDTSSSHAVARDEIAPSIKFLTECNSHRITRNNESSNTDDSVTTQLNSSQNEGFLIGKLKPEEWDTTLVSAAKALMSISSGCSANPIEQPHDVDTSNLPQYSSDSFERMTLQLSEVQSEDRRATTEPSNANKTEKNVGVVRLRRGRGFRDFQKEVLPGLVTLSRHEICEDLHNIGYKLRRVSSRNDTDNWFVPVRSRRSKLCSGRRRRLSSP